ncbi:MAG: RNA polymerase sigma factor, partial [Dehalococcoidia bacterium]
PAARTTSGGTDFEDWGLSRLLVAVTRATAGDDDLEPPTGSIAAINHRDPESWHALFSAEMPAIYRYALSRVGNPSDAEDLTSQVFEEAWKSASSLEDRGIPPRGWLFGIARNVVGSHRRRLFRRPPELNIEAYEAAADDPALAPEAMDLANAIGRLPRSQAEVVTLRFLHGLSLQETAEALSTTVDGVKGRQARALASLRGIMEGSSLPGPGMFTIA